MKKELLPSEIVEYLNKYVISQDEAKKNVAVALRNRYRRKMISDQQLKDEIIPKNVIMVGPTGVGKTEIARRLASIANAPFIKVEATKYTEVGYVGKDVESIIKELVEMTLRDAKAKKMEEVKSKYFNIIHEKIAAKIISAKSLAKEDLKKVTDEVKNGKYDDFEIEVDMKRELHSPIIEIYSNSTSEEIGNELQDAIDNMLDGFVGGKKAKKRKMKVLSAINYYLKEEIEKRIDTHDLIPDVINQVEDDGIVFIDEIDKITERDDAAGKGEVSRQGVQRDILPIVEGTTVMTKYGPVKTNHILFIASGAFSHCSPSDLMPELQGRFPIRVDLKNLTQEDFVKILEEKDNNLIKQYISMLHIDKVTLQFDKEAILQIADYAMQMNEKIENIGARRLATVLEEVLKDVMFEAPYKTKKELKIDKNYVESKMKEKVKIRNLNDYVV